LLEFYCRFNGLLRVVYRSTACGGSKAESDGDLVDDGWRIDGGEQEDLVDGRNLTER
jgi:hypothetical protein